MHYNYYIIICIIIKLQIYFWVQIAPGYAPIVDLRSAFNYNGMLPFLKCRIQKFIHILKHTEKLLEWNPPNVSRGLLSCEIMDDLYCLLHTMSKYYFHPHKNKWFLEIWNTIMSTICTRTLVQKLKTARVFCKMIVKIWILFHCIFSIQQFSVLFKGNSIWGTTQGKILNTCARAPGWLYHIFLIMLSYYVRDS